MSNLFDKAKETVGKAKEKIAPTVEQAKEKAAPLLDKGHAKAEELAKKGGTVGKVAGSVDKAITKVQPQAGGVAGPADAAADKVEGVVSPETVAPIIPDAPPTAGAVEAAMEAGDPAAISGLADPAPEDPPKV